MPVSTHAAETSVQFASNKVMFGRFKKLYFVGIGGAGMSGIAEILHNLGFEISGSDTTPSEVTDYLARLNITVHDQHRADQVDGTDVLVISSAVDDKNPEVARARDLGIPIIKRAEMLGELMRLKYSVGIAGTHGKTTTTSMIGKILRATDLHPTLIVGGVVAELGTGASLGRGDYLVTEVDEYDRSIYAAFPTMAIVMNIERDHLDCYTDEQDLRQSFLKYINRVPFFGMGIVCADDPGVRAIAPEITRPYVTFGFSDDADYRATDVKFDKTTTSVTVLRRGAPLGTLTLHVPGRHNVLNALAATAAATELEIDFTTIATSLSQFTGVGRRFERIGEANGVTVVDDYAHHPTEITATLQTARQLFDGRLIAVFQPHLYSRTRDFLDDFVRALAETDRCILTDIYPAREEPIPGITSDRIREEAEELGYDHFTYVGKKENAIERAAGEAGPGDVILIIGAGSITHIRMDVLKRLEER